MGLDNGIYVKSCDRKLTRKDLPLIIDYPFGDDENDTEIVYWRKYWGLRNEIVRNFPYVDGTIYFHSPDSVKQLIDIISSWISKERWDEDSGSIWDFEEAEPNLIRSIINLTAIYQFMVDKYDVYLEFYDSY